MSNDDFKRTFLIPIFILSSVMVYAGSVNLGFSGIFPAIPFIAVLIGFAIKYKGNYLNATVCILILCGALYALKKQESPIFYPAIGETVTANVPFCITSSQHAHKQYLFAQWNFDEGCEIGEVSGGQTVVGEIVHGEKFEISATEVSHPDFSERYYFVLETESGPLKIDPESTFYSETFNLDNGEHIRASDLRRSVFYYPSLLMYYPILPIIMASFIADLKSFTMIFP